MSDDQRDLLQRFVEAINGGQVPLEEDMQAVSALLAEVLAGGTLKLSKPRGRPKGGNWSAEMWAAEMLFDGLSYDQACLENVPMARSAWYELKKTYDPVIAYVNFLGTRPDADKAEDARLDLMAKLDAIKKSK
jgi:hypothetical protein